MRSIVAPGQGSQTPGMLSAWLEDPHLAELLSEWSEASGIDLVTLGTTADAATIQDTAVAQPLIVATSLLAHAALGSPLPGVTAGHSVGELAALAIAQVLTPAEAVNLAAVRGRAMAEAAALTPTGMSAVVGGTRDEVLDAIAASGADVANVNSSGQVVAAGTTEQLAALSEAPPTRARVIPLAVAGAFHTQHMAPAVAAVERAVEGLSPADPATRLLSNRDGSEVTSGEDALARIVTQMTSAVRWDLCSDTLAALGVDGLVELAPAGVLSGLAKRELKIAITPIKSPEDCDPARELLTEGTSR